MFSRLALCLLLVGWLGTATVNAQTEHVVRRGETLSEIAKTYQTTVKAIIDANNLRNAHQIRIGQKLTVPVAAPSYTEYKVRSGDSLSRIAQRHGITVPELSRINNLRNANQIRVGQTLKIPSGNGGAATVESPYAALPASTLSALRSVRTKPNQWKHIVIHHSGTRVGSAASMDRYHREERRMENGLAYHFVIGNGSGMADGEIALGQRWRRQLQGGHLSSYQLNQVSIGICLVGDFERSRPTRKQMDRLEALVRFLMEEANIPSARVSTHTLMHPRHTACPGRNFPTESFRKSLAN